MIWPMNWWSGPRSKAQRRLDVAKAQERARERRAELDAQRDRMAAKKRESWERMQADIARKYSAHA
jgi:hypothetical protein